MEIIFFRSLLVFAITIAFVVNISKGLHIKTTSDNSNQNNRGIYKQKVGLTNQKISLLKFQKNQQGTVELINRFVEENENANVKVSDSTNLKGSSFLNMYRNQLKQLKLSSSALKTSLNFELSDKPPKNLKRSRRKIVVKVVSDIPSGKIDDLLQIFSEKHGINKYDNYDNDISHTNGGYFPINLPSAMDPDYMYDNLYEDEEDLAVPAKSNHNSQHASLQDLILLATRNQWHREMEETKLHNRNTEHIPFK